MKKFEKGKTYYAWTQKGELRLMKVTGVSQCGNFIKAIYHNNQEKVMKIKGGENQWVEADARYKVVVTADEYKPVDEKVNVSIVDRVTNIKLDYYTINESDRENEVNDLILNQSNYIDCDIYMNGTIVLSF